MAKNYIQDGQVLTVIAPAGGATAGLPVKIGALIGIALASAAAGEGVAIQLYGVWQLPCTAGLATGAMVKWDAASGKMVADAAKDGDDLGKLVAGESDGVAHVLLVQ